MVYQFEELIEGIFIERPNRYIAKVAINNAIVTVHVHDPGRLQELLYEGNTCLIKYAASEKRKTDWDMIAAKKNDGYVLIHSGYHRYIAEAILSSSKWTPFDAVYTYRAEVKTFDSRLDFCLMPSENERIWVEVKGCSLSEDGTAKFPDAPTVRGRRHLETLMKLKASGDRAAVLLLILSEAERFVPKRDTDPDFYKTFYEAIAQGVEVYPVKVTFDRQVNGLVYGGMIEIMACEAI
ncbi:DNA/RNA nuclease SfsA [Fusibacter paucivorans]|uniref:Sugar fermentation stimulation protein homolog n=1 Tax=Fusibacter paucivorans TaxID=76009 RepID=A0ABS5PVA6_9FIRM|nr:DNA/RNA nuclease SfsA [Fusibacter paucivorans]MBS7528047.1 DNA/RNA nuclease SfsA [Fusibacter paucivorans]